MIHILIIFILLCLNQQQATITLQIPRIISNTSLNIEEYGTIKFDCLIEQRILAAWRISLRHDNIYQYYYTNPNLRNKFLQFNEDEDEDEDKLRDVLFENNLHTMIFHNVRQWINNAFETIECIIYNNKTSIFERMIFYLHVYVSPFLFSLNINNVPLNDQSIFSFDDKQQMKIFCETYSYPKSTLQFSFNNQIIQSNETIDCLHDDLSSILLSNELCLSQTNWRIHVRISTEIFLSKKHDKQNFTCSIIHFPYGNSWKHSTSIQFIERKVLTEESTKLSTSSILSFKYSRITEPIINNSVFLTLLTTQTTIIKQSQTFLLLENRYWYIGLICFGLIILFIIFSYLIYKNKRKKVFSIKPI